MSELYLTIEMCFIYKLPSHSTSLTLKTLLKALNSHPVSVSRIFHDCTVKNIRYFLADRLTQVTAAREQIIWSFPYGNSISDHTMGPGELFLIKFI